MAGKLPRFTRPLDQQGAAGQVLWLSSLGIELVAFTAAGVAGGWYLDKLIHTSPVFVIIGFFVGTAAGFYQIVKAVKRLDRSNDAQK